jgi:carboxymethylenebutenolidase
MPKVATTQVPTPDGPMILHWAEPDTVPGARALPGILVFQEAFGVNAHIKRVCERLAAAGYIAVAPELFHREAAGAVYGYDEFDKVRPVFGRLTNDLLLADIRAAYGALVGHPAVDPRRTFSLGFCVGGFVSILAALNLPLAAAASFYGGGVTKARPGVGLSPLIGEFSRLHCPTLHVFGAEDQSISSEDIAQVRSTLEALRKPFEIEVVPGAGHGFFCEDRAAYRAGAAETAWKQALRWLAEIPIAGRP